MNSPITRILAGGNTPPDPIPPHWGPGTMFRMGLVVFAVLIAAVLLYRLLA